jgi:hypothetical protein
MDYLKTVSPGFWSVTMYDGVTSSTVPNPINRYSLGGDDELTRAADGSGTGSNRVIEKSYHLLMATASCAGR